MGARRAYDRFAWMRTNFIARRSDPNKHLSATLKKKTRKKFSRNHLREKGYATVLARLMRAEIN